MSAIAELLFQRWDVTYVRAGYPCVWLRWLRYVQQATAAAARPIVAVIPITACVYSVYGDMRRNSRRKSTVWRRATVVRHVVKLSSSRDNDVVHHDAQDSNVYWKCACSRSALTVPNSLTTQSTSLTEMESLNDGSHLTRWSTPLIRLPVALN